ncbi:hypothetical protein [Streptomyces nanshensis]|uniref:hypothetical protein n=1 Tax=Streptomyces nanshensis TaxID=518642 RepID=UPI00114C960D|nr:hypothetical protein [Streptomyces nanshensis]
MIYQWHERAEDDEKYVNSWEVLGRITFALRECARVHHRRLVGAMEYDFVHDRAELAPGTWRHIRRMRWRTEPLPWRWSRLVLVRAWQQTVPLPESGTR